VTGFPVRKHRFPVGKTGFPIFEFEVPFHPVSGGFHREPAGFPFPDSGGKTLPDGNVNPGSVPALREQLWKPMGQRRRRRASLQGEERRRWGRGGTAVPLLLHPWICSERGERLLRDEPSTGAAVGNERLDPCP